MSEADEIAEDALISRLGFCGCGAPDQVLRLVRDVLRHVNEKSPDHGSGRDAFSEWYDEWDRRGLELMPSRGIQDFIYYVLTEKDLLEHGGSVPGWLTAEGEALLAKLEALPDPEP